MYDISIFLQLLPVCVGYWNQINIPVYCRTLFFTFFHSFYLPWLAINQSCFSEQDSVEHSVCHFSDSFLITCFAQRNSLAVSLLSGWLFTASDKLVSKRVAHPINSNGESWCWKAPFIILFCFSFTHFTQENFLNYSEWVDICHLEPLRQCELGYPQLFTSACGLGN